MRAYVRQETRSQGLLPAQKFIRVGTGCGCSLLKIRRVSIGYRVAEPSEGRVCTGCGYPVSEYPGSTRESGVTRHIFIIFLQNFPSF